jgi:hypothetical protein
MGAVIGRDSSDDAARQLARAIMQEEVQARVLDALTVQVVARTNEEKENIRELVTRLQRMRDCGKFPAAVVLQRGSIIGTSKARCKARLCPYCHDVKRVRGSRC